MTTELTLDQLRSNSGTSAAKPDTGDVRIGLFSTAEFELTYRVAKALSATSMVPPQYRQVIQKYNTDGTPKGAPIENPSGIANTMVALNMAARLNTDVLMLMQSLVVVEGRNSWSAQWVIAQIEASPKYTGLRWTVVNKGPKKISYTENEWIDGVKQVAIKEVTLDNIEWTAWTTRASDSEPIRSVVDMEMAVKEGWYQRKGSKWQTIPDQMGKYRSATFLGRLTVPDRLLGLGTEEEIRDTIDVHPDGSFTDPLQPAAKPSKRPAAAPVAKDPAPAEEAQPATAAAGPAPAEPAPSEPAARTPAPEPAFEWAEAMAARVRSATSDAELDVIDGELGAVAGSEAHQILSGVVRARRAELRSARPQLDAPKTPVTFTAPIGATTAARAPRTRVAAQQTTSLD
jgi:hypothetical protein